MSKYAGIQWLARKRGSAWHAGYDGFSLGVWPTEQEAAVARDRAMLHRGVPVQQLQEPKLSVRLGAASPDELCRLAYAREHEFYRCRGRIDVARLHAEANVTLCALCSPGYQPPAPTPSRSRASSIRAPASPKPSRSLERTASGKPPVSARGGPPALLSPPPRKRAESAPAAVVHPIPVVSKVTPSAVAKHTSSATHVAKQVAAAVRDRPAGQVRGPAATSNPPSATPKQAPLAPLRKPRAAHASSLSASIWRTPAQTFRVSAVLQGKAHAGGNWPTEDEAEVACDRLLLHLGCTRQQLRRPQKSVKLGPATPGELRRLARMRVKVVGEVDSIYLGVSRTVERRWTIAVQAGRQRHTVSSYRHEEEAAVARDRLALHLMGRAATLNFPERNLRPASREALQRELAEIMEERGEKVSRYRGVYLRAPAGRRPWGAQVSSGEKVHKLGNWKTELEAAIAHDRAALYYDVPRGWMNFPDKVASLAPANAETLRAEAVRSADRAGPAPTTLAIFKSSLPSATPSRKPRGQARPR